MAFSKVSFVTWLRNNGSAELMEFYNQGTDRRLGSMDTTSQGWCHGVAVQWLKTKVRSGFDDSSFWQWIETPEAAGAFRFLMADQAVRPKLALMLAQRAVSKGFASLATAKSQLGEDYSNKSSTYLLRAGISLIAKHDSTFGNTQVLARDVTGTPGKYARIGLFFSTGGGHAVSACSDGRRWRFMDPNAGEIQISSTAKFNEWFPKYYSMRYASWPLGSYYVEKYN